MEINDIYDFIVIGAGILGLCTANEIRRRYPQAKIVILEKEFNIGMHASGRNSGVLHSGIYYPSSSIKAKVCSNGARKMREFAAEHQIDCKRVGKVIIPTSTKDIPVIDYLLSNAVDNGIEAEKLSIHSIKSLEPHCQPIASGIYTPTTACIDSKQVLENLSSVITKSGTEIKYGERVMHVDAVARKLSTQQHQFSYGYLFNCAGTGTDLIAKQFNLAQHYRLLPFKGIYYRLNPAKSDLVNSNIYPVPDLNLPFLGVHFTKNVKGEVYVGPTAIPAFGRENYGIFAGMSREALRILKDLAMMYVANQQHFRLLMRSECLKYFKPYFLKNARKLVPNISMADLLPSHKVGIRPQLINTKTNKIEMDYILERDEYSCHVLNAISPAFTSAFAFAELLLNQMEDHQVSSTAA